MNTETDIVTPADESLSVTIQNQVDETVAKVMVQQVPKVAAEIAQHEIVTADKNRQAIEDHRADRRNRNRVYILLVALMLTFLIPFLIADILHWDTLLKFSTAIAVVPDFGLTMYAYFRKF